MDVDRALEDFESSPHPALRWIAPRVGCNDTGINLLCRRQSNVLHASYIQVSTAPTTLYNQYHLTSGSQIPASQTITISPCIQRALLSINQRNNKPNTTAEPSKTSIPVLVLAVPRKLRHSLRPLCMRANRVPRDGHPANATGAWWYGVFCKSRSHPILVRACILYNAVG